MKRILLGLAAAVVLAATAIAADLMATRYENTVTLTDATGVTKIYYNKDGTLTTVLPNGQKGTGKWVVKGDKLCVTLDAGPSAGQETCTPLVERKVGDTWDVTLADGTKVKAALVKGR
jgi:opacity protein-like surface antigen